VLRGVPRGASASQIVDHGVLEHDGLTRVCIEDRRFAVLGRLAVGDGSEVFMARRDARVTENVVLKVLRTTSDGDLLAREWQTLEALMRSTAQGHEHFRRLLPQPVVHGKIAERAGRLASVFRWRSGFSYTLDDVMRRYERGVDPRAAVWMWKRVLELLGWVHRAGYVHGAVTPPHVLIHPRDHGAVLVGWSCATHNQRLPAVSLSQRAYYPNDTWTRGVATPATDMIMLARCIASVLGGDAARGSVPSSVPSPVAALVMEQAERGSDDAWAVMERVSEAGVAAFGAPRFVTFHME
jgi:hypothetical protein